MIANITSTFAQSVKPLTTGAQLDVWDTILKGFVLRVSPGGTKTWMVRYQQHGRKRRFKLGRFPKLTVADARQQARKYLGQVAAGDDPGRELEELKREPTFADLADRFMNQYAIPRYTPRTVIEVRRMLDNDVLPAWGSRKISTITRRDVIDLLDKIKERGAPVHSNRVKALISSMFSFALDKEMADNHPALRVRSEPETPRERVLRDDELRAFWEQLDREDIDVAAGFKLILLTAGRSSEVFEMMWSEVDLDSGWWTLPASRSKNRKEHRIPLVPSAVELLRHLQASKADADDGRIIPAFKQRYGLAKIRKAAGLVDHFTIHDLRRTVATKLAQFKIPRLTISKLLNHSEAGVTHVYDRYSYDHEKQQALLHWEKRLREIVEPHHLHLVQGAQQTA
jgi:integrase